MGMITATNTVPVTGQIMTIDPVLTLAQWFSPAFPVGAFAYSHGLEQAIAENDVTDPATLQTWIEDVLHFGAGRSDALFIVAAYRAAPDELQAIDARARAFTSSKERRMETDLLGEAFGRIASSLSGDDISGLCYPVAVGKAARLATLPLELTTHVPPCLRVQPRVRRPTPRPHRANGRPNNYPNPRAHLPKDRQQGRQLG